MNVEDDSENDSDYEPGKDDENDNDNDAADDNTGLTDISFSRKRKSNSLWDEMQQEEKKYCTSFKHGFTKDNKPTQTTKKLKKNQQVLAQIFGNTVAKKLTEITSLESDSLQPVSNGDALSAVKKIQKKSKIIEVRKFAGESIRFGSSCFKFV